MADPQSIPAVSFELAPTRSAPSEARAALGPVAEGLAPRDFLDLSAVVSELVASCVRHRSEGPVRVEVRVERGAARGLVFDDMAHLGEPVPEKGPDAERISRRILDALCREWRAVDRDGATGVEFRLAPSG